MLSAMNSLNIVSRLTAPPSSSPARSRTGSVAIETTEAHESEDGQQLDTDAVAEKLGVERDEGDGQGDQEREERLNEKTPLLGHGANEGGQFKDAPGSGIWSLPRRVSQAVLHGVKMVFSAITAPGRYVVACFYDDEGHFSTIMPLRSFRTLFPRRKRKQQSLAETDSSAYREKKQPRRTPSRRTPSVDSKASSTSAGTSDNETGTETNDDSPARHTRSRSAALAADPPHPTHPTQKKSIQIKLSPDEALRQRRAAKHKKSAPSTTYSNSLDPSSLASSLKSPSSPASLTRYPRLPAPPRPLVPRRQNSYTLTYPSSPPKKTLIIDLDETLIHSMAKGGRMSTGHMVEVRLGNPFQSPATSSTPGAAAFSGVPILYYVHERPGCHEFLRKVAKWYNLIVFTASVQEYADPVIDWLERERRYFSGRYYRQHCTLRNGAYIKDLAQVEPDLSRVMILDNSPMSYIFHEDNAVPIEGWISDPTDNDLLHLIPFLEGLQYVTDVRALLALRQGQGAPA